MAAIRQPKPVKLICAVMLASDINRTEIIGKLISHFGAIDYQGPVFDFSAFTAYYQAEMGVGLTKQFVSFERLYDPTILSKTKIITNGIEAAYSESQNRCVNLDPGYVTAAKLVLATTKDFAHRIYLGDGIYGDVQFRFRQKQFEASRWTYPDYQTDTAQEFLNQVRNRYMQQERSNEKIHQL